VLIAKCPEFGKKRRKIYRGIMGGKKAEELQTAVFAFSLSLKVNNPKRKQNGKMRRSSRPCSGRFKKPQEPPRKTYPFFLSVRPKQSRKF
jgi:hypothetical protein